MNNEKTNGTETQKRVTFAAINPYTESHIVAPVQEKAAGSDMVRWGKANAYPQYLAELYDNVTTLHTIIDGDADFTAGDDVLLAPGEDGKFRDGIVDRKGTTASQQVHDLAHDLDLYGGFALQVIRDKAGRPAELVHLPFERLRSDADNQCFWYSEKWGTRKVGATAKAVVYPKFLPGLEYARLTPEEQARHAASILYVKRDNGRTYPSPIFAAAIKACETERCTDTYHLNAINNNFEGSVMVNFNNGKPTDEIMEQVEADFTEKYTGFQNALRVIFSWNDSKETATTVTPMVTRDFGEKYRALSEHCRQQIYTAFRAVPSLFGLPTASGFSTEEYEEAFKLYNRTRIQPMQRTIIDAYAKVLGAGRVTIVPFSLSGSGEDTIK